MPLIAGVDEDGKQVAIGVIKKTHEAKVADLSQREILTQILLELRALRMGLAKQAGRQPDEWIKLAQPGP